LKLFLVHHGDAVTPEVDPRRPLSMEGLKAVEEIAGEAARRGARPAVVWHSGKLRARQTAEACWRASNALAEFSATRDLQPDDPPGWFRDRLRGESRDILIAGHFPHLPRLLSLLLPEATGQFPLHGAVALVTEDDGETWKELWRLEVKSETRNVRP
jgi:phosphohistidine phosphatase